MERDKVSMGQSTSNFRFSTVPPERVGLCGEYDYYGLSKRVTAALTQNFEPDEIQGLRVTQRGAVVVILGAIVNQRLLIQLVQVIMGINGAADVEVNGVSVGYSLRYYLEGKPSRATLGKLVGAMNRSL